MPAEVYALEMEGTGEEGDPRRPVGLFDTRPEDGRPVLRDAVETFSGGEEVTVNGSSMMPVAVLAETPAHDDLKARANGVVTFDKQELLADVPENAAVHDLFGPERDPAVATEVAQKGRSRATGAPKSDAADELFGLATAKAMAAKRMEEGETP